ncbi:unnamed protein product [Hymenolepis diminuta]|uniref:Parvovirus non-structural protein 1 helicase domain-containing protein n=1 Tax=Hymenolepis diminuta TaxID=6216 RepID=A0A564Z930_HYMDI|nr:unnamed protein product [Hymenolepis diminuta]
MLNMNKANIIHLLDYILKIMDMKTYKVNYLCSYGQTNTGKSLLAQFITSHLRFGAICRRTDQTAFHFDNLLNRTVALMGEPRITMTIKNYCKIY